MQGWLPAVFERFKAKQNNLLLCSSMGEFLKSPGWQCLFLQETCDVRGIRGCIYTWSSGVIVRKECPPHQSKFLGKYSFSYSHGKIIESLKLTTSKRSHKFFSRTFNYLLLTHLCPNKGKNVERDRYQHIVFIKCQWDD